MGDAIDRVEDDAGAQDDAARAFEALRAEVASLRRGIELVTQQGREAKSVDYSLTLGEMAQALEGLQARLAAIEGKPLLAMTPAIYREQIVAAARSAGEAAGRALEAGAAAQSAAACELREVTSRVRGAREQRWWLAGAAGGGVLGGLLLWVAVIVLLPLDWGTSLVALPLAHGDRWGAGLVFLREADPARFDRLAKLSQACGPMPVDQCAAAIARGAAPAEPKGAAPVPERRR
jgi:hypothetical protein